MATNPLLDFSTTIDRNFIKIDGVVYPIRHLSEFSLMERHVMAAIARPMSGVSKLGSEESGAIDAIEKAEASQ